ncbi:MAG: glycosyltransferase family 39 protein [Planctomycetota bacterium]
MDRHQSESPAEQEPPKGDPRAWIGLAGALLYGLMMRVEAARGTSLWLDELHTLHHAAAPSLGALLEGLRADNHPPLSFVLVRASRALFGEGELALRLPALAAGAAAVWLVYRLARRTLDRWWHGVAPWLVAASSLHLVASAEARMYSLLALWALLWIDGALGLAERERGGALRVGAATALGLLTHYHCLHVLAVLGGAGLVALPRGRRLALIGAAAGGALAAAPWYAYGFLTQLGHEMPPGGSTASLRRLAEGMVHLLFHNASLAGPAKPLFVAAGGLALVLAALGAARLVRAQQPAKRRAGILVGAAVFALPAWAALVAMILPRAGFHWTYLTASAPPLALLIAAAAEPGGRLPRLRLGAVFAVLLAAVLLASKNANAPSREDYRGAVRHVLTHGQPDDVVIAADWQPPLFEHGRAWDYYAPRLGDPAALPPRLAVEQGFVLEEPERLAGAPRAYLLGRSLKPDAPVLASLRQHYAQEEVHRFGEAIFLHVFWTPR